jgi:hypothetical protein
MKKFNNSLPGTDCGDAGLPERGRDIAKARPVFRVISETREKDSIKPRLLAAKSRKSAPARMTTCDCGRRK